MPLDLNWLKLAGVSLVVAVLWSAWREVSGQGRARTGERDYDFSWPLAIKRTLAAWVFIFFGLVITSMLGLTEI